MLFPESRALNNSEIRVTQHHWTWVQIILRRHLEFWTNNGGPHGKTTLQQLRGTDHDCANQSLLRTHENES